MWKEGLSNIRIVIQVVLLNIFNGLDCILTLNTIRNYDDEELNPLMAFLLNKSPILFILVKAALAIIASTVAIRFSHMKVTRVCLLISVIGYMLVVIYHIVILTVVNM